MRKSLNSMIPNAESVLELEPEELAGVVIEFLNSLSTFEQQQLNRHNFLIGEAIQGYPAEFHDKIKRAFSEAWAWLERECLVAPAQGGSKHLPMQQRRSLV